MAQVANVKTSGTVDVLEFLKNINNLLPKGMYISDISNTLQIQNSESYCIFLFNYLLVIYKISLPRFYFCRKTSCCIPG